MEDTELQQEIELNTQTLCAAENMHLGMNDASFRCKNFTSNGGISDPAAHWKAAAAKQRCVLKMDILVQLRWGSVDGIRSLIP